MAAMIFSRFILCLLFAAIFWSYKVDCDPCTLTIHYYRTKYLDSMDYYTEATCLNYVNLSGIVKNFDLRRVTVTVNEPRDENWFLEDDINKFISLTMKNGNLTTIPEKVAEMVSLENITVTGTKIKSINISSFAELDYLSKLNLANNMIDVIIPNRESRISKVTDFDLSHNYIQLLPDKFLQNFGKLQYLNMSHNNLSNIGLYVFDGLVKLQSLDLSYNKINKIGLAFAKMSNLEMLYLSNNNITKLLDYDFFTMKNLKELDVSSNSISVIESKSFLYLQNLRHLDLGHNQLNTEHNLNISNTTILSMNLTNMSTLNNSLNRIESIPPLVFSPLESLKILDLSHNQLNILDFEITNRSSLYLNLSKNEITALNINSFKNMPGLVGIDLSFNKIAYIQPGSFLDLKKLTSLNFTGNYINFIMFGVLNGPEELTELNLSKNMLHTFDAQLLPKYKDNKVKLSLDHNALTDLNLPLFFENGISDLSLEGNNITCTSLAVLRKSKFNEKLQSIKIANVSNIDSENVDGIPCTTVSDDTAKLITTNNFTFNITNRLNALNTAVEKISLSLKIVSEFNEKNEKLLDSFVKITNETLEGINNSLKQLTK